MNDFSVKIEDVAKLRRIANKTLKAIKETPTEFLIV